MCGLAGYILRDSVEKSPEVMKDMLDLQRHRGPDDSGIVGINWEENVLLEKEFKNPSDFDSSVKGVFGFNRLSILDLSPNGHQPMISIDRNVILMMNGEIYNAFDFKEELLSKGYQFKSETDTEVVLHLYSEYGIEGMLERLNGMFAITIFDFSLNSLFLARDRFGIKPLYVLREGNRLAFSSEMKSFKALPNFKFILDTSHLDEFLIFRNLVNNTLFKNIENLTPGTYVRFHLNSWKEETIPFYDMDKEGENKISSEEAKKLLRDTLQKSVKRQMVSDVKLGTQLSGGVDSSLVTYFASQELRQGDLETVSITFGEKGFSEEKYVDIVAKKMHLKSHKFELKGDYYLSKLQKATWHFEQPINHPNTIGIYFLSEQAKKHVTVLLSGEGADESLAGYSRFIENRRNPFFTRTLYNKLRENKKNVAKVLARQLNPSLRVVLSSSFTSPETIKDIRKGFSLGRATERRLRTYKYLKGTELQRQRKYELLTYLPDLLMRQDKMSMAHSIENRVPFLDNEMVEVALNLSDELLISEVDGNFEGKNVLKQVCEEAFSRSFAYRDKMGFGIPLRVFFSSKEFQNSWKHELMPKIEERGLFEVKKMNKWVTNLQKVNSGQLDAIWMMVAFEFWAKQYLD